MICSINSSHGTSTPFKTCCLRLAQTPVTLVVDIGAKVSVLQEALYKQHFLDYPLQTADRKLVTYDNTEIPVKGIVRLPVSHESTHIEQFPFYVTARGSSLLGVDLFDRLGFEIQKNGTPIQTVDIVSQFPSVFSGFGTITGVVHRPRVDPTVKPVSQSLRRLPFSIREEVSAELKRLNEQGITEPIDSSPWISNLVVARRKSGEIRLCVDLKAVNKAIIPDKYPLPTIEELSAEFHHSAVFSKLDMRRSYLQVPLAEDSKYLTAFITHDGIFQYCRMPYGLSSAPSAFQKVLSSVLKDTEGCSLEGCIHLIDDIVIHGRNLEEHDTRLKAVMEKITKSNIALNHDKCQFRKEEIDFLGYHVTAEGVRPLKSNVKAIIDLPEPRNPSEVASFLGATNFYLKFVENYADVAEPLRKLIRKDVPWTWSQEQQQAFSCLKQKITSAPVLSHFDPEAPTIVTTDASGIALGAVLSQMSNGIEKPVAYASKTLSMTERKYSTGEREALACIFACEHWHVFLFGRKFTLRTDHQALTTLLETTGSGHKPLRIYRWSDRLHQYNFDVKYVSGSKNQVADMLSRLIHDTKPSKPTDEDMPVLEIQLDVLVNLADLTKASSEDPILQQVRQYIQNGWPPHSPSSELEPYFRLRNELSVFNESCVARGFRAIIPEKLQKTVLKMAHDGHPGIVRTKQRCRDSVWWPGLDHHIEEHVKNCEACAFSEKSSKPIHPPLQTLPWPKTPWSTIQDDIFGEVQAAPPNQRFLVVVHDLHSKWPEIAATSSVTSATVIRILRDLFSRWGLPQVLITDNGPQFVSHEFEGFLKTLGIEHRRTARYNPQANGGVERLNRVIKEGLSAQLTEGKTFIDALRTVLMTYRSTPHALTNVTPAELMLGRKLRYPLEALKPAKNARNTELATAIEHRQKRVEKYTDRHRHSKESKLKPGDWVRTKYPNRKHKLSSSLSKPKLIVRKVGPNTFELEDGSRWNSRRCVKSCQSAKSSSYPEGNFDTIDLPNDDHQQINVPVRLPIQRPRRNRRPPQYYGDYVPR